MLDGRIPYVVRTRNVRVMPFDLGHEHSSYDICSLDEIHSLFFSIGIFKPFTIAGLIIDV